LWVKSCTSSGVLVAFHQGAELGLLALAAAHCVPVQAQCQCRVRVPYFVHDHARVHARRVEDAGEGVAQLVRRQPSRETRLVPLAARIKALPDGVDMTVESGADLWSSFESFTGSRPDLPDPDQCRIPNYSGSTTP
jgi:hypothetical protein